VNRRSLIISNPGELGAKNYCEGVFKDVENYKKFLSSPIGGYWGTNVVEHLDRRTEKEVKAALSKISSADYSLIVFCGHGYHSDETDSTILELRKGEEIDSDDLRGVTSKQTIILDCCRVRAKTLLLEDRLFEAALAKSHKFDGEACRRYYNNQIVKCRDGIIVLKACSIDEEAGDDSEKGGYYSYNLLKFAKRWANETIVNNSIGYDILSAPEAHELCKSNVIDKSKGAQHPQIEKARSEPYFPFTIVA
jgi:hypothetical protein